MIEGSHAEIEELLGAYALDAVDPDERDLVDQHLPTCARCRSEVQADREVAALLAHSGAPAPEGLWERIVESLEAPPPRLDLVPRNQSPAGSRSADPIVQARPRAWATRAMLGALAAAAAVIAVLGIQVRDQGDQLDSVRTAMGEKGLTDDLVVAAGDPDARRVELTSADGRLEGVRAVLVPDGTGYLLAGSLPELAEGSTAVLSMTNTGKTLNTRTTTKPRASHRRRRVRRALRLLTAPPP